MTCTRILNLTAALCLTLVLSQCGPTNREIIDKYRKPVSELHASLREVVVQLPPAAQVSSEQTCGSLSAPVLFDEAGKDSNASILMQDEILNPDVDPEFSLNLGGTLLNSLRWTGPKNPMSVGVMDQKARDGSGESFDRILQTSYVIIMRINELRLPQPLSVSEYTAGTIALDVFVVDLPQKKNLCSFRIQEVSDPNVSYVYKKGDSQTDRLLAFAKSNLLSKVKKTLVENLSRINGAQFKFR